jgi:beta-phosphoglucomutase-like phosphatase (HAD superfamily)
MLVDAPPPLIRLARESVLAANRLMPTAIVSASGRASIEATMRRMTIGDAINFYAGAEDYARPKPAPDGYLAAAAAVGVDPGACLVFEDSIPGMQSARNAGMQLIAVTHRCNDIKRATALSDAVIRDYADLDEQFFSRICGGTSQR